MTTNDSVFNGSIPEIYDEYLVPLIFEDYADDLADRVVSVTPTSVLELAAGSGVVTRALAPRLSPRHGHRFESEHAGSSFQCSAT